MQKRIIALLILALFMAGPNVSKLYAKEKGLKLQCQVLVAASEGDFTSIQDAIDYLNPVTEIPCTILVAAGTYTENILITKSDIHLKGSGSGKTFLQPVENNPVIKVIGANEVRITGITIKDSLSVGDSAGIESLNSSITIAESQFIDNQTAISLGGSKANIENNVFENNKGGGIGSVSSLSSQLLFSKNTIIGGEAVTIDTENSYGNITTATITKNTFLGVSPPIEINRDCPGCSTRIIANEIFGEGHDQGIRSYGSAVISENTIEDYAQYAIYIPSGQAVIANNLLRGSQVGVGAAIVNSGTSTITGNTILNYPGDGVKNIEGVVTINGNTLMDIGRFGVSSIGLAVIMGNAFVNNSLGCVEYTAGTVAANSCNNSGALSVYGTITSPENLTIQAGKNFIINTGGDWNVVANNVNAQSNNEMTLTAGKNVNMSADSNISIEANKDISTSANNTSIASSNDTNFTSVRDTTTLTGRDTTILTDGNTEIRSGGWVFIKGDKPLPN